MRSRLSIILVLILTVYSYSQALFINEVMSANILTLQDEEEDYPDWIEIFNASAYPVNLLGYGLSDDPSQPLKWTFPVYSIDPDEKLRVFASGKDRISEDMHTNFKIKSNGEPILLTSPSGELLDSVDSGYIPLDISRGRMPDGGDEWVYFPEPTPGRENSAIGFAEISESPEFSITGGIFHNIISISLSSSAPGAVIRFTTDGAPPNDSSEIYTSPLVIDSTVVIRARLFEEGKLFSDPVTNTYILYDNHDLPVVSLSTDPFLLWDWEEGMYVMGPNANPNPPYYGANFWEDWEYPFHIEMYEPDGSLGFSQDAGVKIAGGYNRHWPQKSMAVFARDKYGDDTIEYQVFPDKQIFDFTSLLLRNGGNDWDYNKITDGVMSRVLDNTNIDHQAFRPTIIFLNGEYWGLLFIREKMNEDFLETHHGVDPDNVDMLENQQIVIEGDSLHYAAMIEFLETNDITVPENYEYLNTQMEVHDFIDYMAAEIWIGNGDWPYHNIKYWRPKTPSGIWKWLLFDVDCGFYDPAHNTLAIALDPAGPYQPNPPWSTFLLRTLMENEEFQTDFITRSSDLMNFTFEEQRVLSLIEMSGAEIEDEVPFHDAKWHESWWGTGSLETFAEDRLTNLRNDYEDQFRLAGRAAVNLTVQPEGWGSIGVNSCVASELPWSGIYFLGMPLSLTAIPEAGYRFDYWEGIEPADSISVEITLSQALDVTAFFTEDASYTDSIAINEINYHSAGDFDTGDWLEFRNNSTIEADISGWIFKDGNDLHSFVFPAETILEPGAYIVLCHDTSLFMPLFPDVENFAGNFVFNLSNAGEHVRLFDANDNLIDSLTYDDESPWPVEPDGNGQTLELSDPLSANHLPENWNVSLLSHGSPGAENNYNTINNSPPSSVPVSSSFAAVFPNPFNPQTNFNFDIAQAGNVNLTIYDVQGRAVAEIIDGWHSPGNYTAKFDGRNLASGIYFAKLQAEGFSKTQKLMLIK